MGRTEPPEITDFEYKLTKIILNFNGKIQKAFDEEDADLDNYNIDQIADAVKESWYTTLLQEYDWNLKY